jgi:hypothetical protein
MGGGPRLIENLQLGSQNSGIHSLLDHDVLLAPKSSAKADMPSVRWASSALKHRDSIVLGVSALRVR